jgi:hypothetical protein
MAIATRGRSKKKVRIHSPITSDSKREHAAPEIAPAPGYPSRDPEPPEQASKQEEAPEARQADDSEAPDAGHGEAWSEEPLSARGRSRN